MTTSTAFENASREDKTLSYHWRVMMPDYVRAAAGVALCAMPLTTPLPVAVLSVCGGLAVCFVLYGVGTWRRQLTSFAVDEHNLTRRGPAPRGREIFPWNSLRKISLAYFSVRGDGRRGWMQLKLEFSSGIVKVDSRLSGFERLAARSYAEGHRLGVALAPVTIDNFASLGFGEGEWKSGSTSGADHG